LQTGRQFGYQQGLRAETESFATESSHEADMVGLIAKVRKPWTQKWRALFDHLARERLVTRPRPTDPSMKFPGENNDRRKSGQQRPILVPLHFHFGLRCHFKITTGSYDKGSSEILFLSPYLQKNSWR
jgi:hypothetical protein